MPKQYVLAVIGNNGECLSGWRAISFKTDVAAIKIVMLSILLVTKMHAVGQAFWAEGILVYEPVAAGAKTISYMYKVAVSNELWRMMLYRVNDEAERAAVRTVGCIFDGRSIAYIRILEDDTNSITINDAVVKMDDGPVPGAHGNLYVSQLWIAYASGHFLSLSGRPPRMLLPPVLTPDRHQPTAGADAPVEIEYLEGLPFLPRQMVVYGKNYKPNSVEIYISHRYQAIVVTNVSGFIIPVTFIIQQYATDGSIISKARGVSSKVESGNLDIDPFLNTFKNAAIVDDRRSFAVRTNAALQPVTYLLKSGEKPPVTLQEAVAMRQRLLAKAESKIQQRSIAIKYYFVLMVILLAALPLYMIKQKAKDKNHENKE